MSDKVIKDIGSSWDSDEKIAAIFYYYLSLTQDSAEGKAARFTDLFNVRKSVECYLNTLGLLDQGETVPDDDDEVDSFLRAKLSKTDVLEHFCIAFDGFADVKDEVIRICEETLADFPADERYELIVDEIDHLREAVDFYNREYLWAFVFAAVVKGGLSEEQRKFLRHFCRVADIGKDVLGAMADLAGNFVTIGKKRKDAKIGTRPYAEVVAELAALDAEEAVTHQTLSTLLGLDGSEADEEGIDDEPCDEKIYEPWADEDSSVIEKLGGTVINVLDGIANGLEEFAAKL
ncbi:hypothetical protein FACS1894147_03440 [Spirochaetia bacterium]|nr:hypothetical protein FACS1894147_03440 [Spirochaetia bacterium]